MRLCCIVLLNQYELRTPKKGLRVDVILVASIYKNNARDKHVRVALPRGHAHVWVAVRWFVPRGASLLLPASQGPQSGAWVDDKPDLTNLAL